MTDSSSSGDRPASWHPGVGAVAPLLLFSGFCALVYQTAWMREFRLIFGASTAASAAVVAVFMGGLGLGGRVLGARADRSANPLMFYGQLEALVAVLAALSPVLVELARRAYGALGGTAELGGVVGTVMRLLLAALVLLPPTFLAGGTLGAAARAVERGTDRRRAATSVLYGVNTLGAVVGCFATTFAMLELLGVRSTLWIASAINLAVAVVAMSLARSAAPLVPEQGGTTAQESAVPTADDIVSVAAPAASPRFVLAAAAIVGFAFFLMEMVWYRMLGPILGGTIYTFGLVLAVALAGIALGGVLYPLLIRPSTLGLHAFAATCLAEAALMAAPYIWGDGVALLALRLRSVPDPRFWQLVAGWAAVAGVVIAPAAVVAGMQFPLLVALLGGGRDRVARHVGLAYFWNTMGGIAGSLAGGFGLLPLLTAPGAWRAVALLLAATALVATLHAPRRRPAMMSAMLAGAVALAVSLFAVSGPTAVWRHSGIGVGRAVNFGMHPLSADANERRAWAHDTRRLVFWEREGVESSVAAQALMGLAFVVNGKIDGNARGDAPTQVMGGLLGVILRGGSKRAMVIGLGTGSTAGWLACLPGMERTDVVELEPAILSIARMSASVNRDAMNNPKLRVLMGDAREYLTTTRERYDLVFSEPSNPYRAGIASLFTREFYKAVDARLSPGGAYLQWVQVYEIDDRTVSTILATLATVFPEVEIWQVHHGDFVLVATRQPLRYDATELARRIAEEPFATALRVAWRATDLHEFLARYVAGSAVARALRQGGQEINTDDHNPIEFAFARTLSRHDLFDVEAFRLAAAAAGAGRPAITGDVDWTRVARHRPDLYTIAGLLPPRTPKVPADDRVREAHALYVHGRLKEAMEALRREVETPLGLTETAIFAEGLAEAGDLAAVPYIEQLGKAQPAEGSAAFARLALRRGRHDLAAPALVEAFERYRFDPWPSPVAMQRAVVMAVEVAAAHPAHALTLFEALASPFALRTVEPARLNVRLRIVRASGLMDRCREAVSAFEPHVPWLEDFLRYRLLCYATTGDPRKALAEADVRRFERAKRR